MRAANFFLAMIVTALPLDPVRARAQGGAETTEVEVVTETDPVAEQPYETIAPLVVEVPTQTAPDPEPTREPAVPSAPPEPEEDEDEAPAIRLTAEPGRGMTVEAGDAFSTTIRARIQIRNTLRLESVAVPTGGTQTVADDVFEIRTARLWWTGHVVERQIRFGLQLALGANDFEPGNPSPIFDAFIESTHVRDLNVRVGQFFVPFDRARTIREFALQTVDRTDVVRELTLDRDVGIALQSTDLFGLGGVLAYHLGFWGGDGRNRLVTTSGNTATPDVGFLYTARVSVRPMGSFDDDQEGDLSRDPRPRLAIGGGLAFNHQTDRPRSTTGVIRTGNARFDYVHAAGDLVFKCAGLSILAEVVYREATADSVTTSVIDPVAMMPIVEHARNGWGYLAQAGMMLHPMVEIWARWEHVEPIRPVAVDAIRSTHGIGGGINVYLNGHALKLQADWTHSFGSDFTNGPHFVRLQIDASF